MYTPGERYEVAIDTILFWSGQALNAASAMDRYYSENRPHMPVVTNEIREANTSLDLPTTKNDLAFSRPFY
jgi:hypothetical protein